MEAIIFKTSRCIEQYCPRVAGSIVRGPGCENTLGHKHTHVLTRLDGLALPPGEWEMGMHGEYSGEGSTLISVRMSEKCRNFRYATLLAEGKGIDSLSGTNVCLRTVLQRDVSIGYDQNNHRSGEERIPSGICDQRIGDMFGAFVV